MGNIEGNKLPSKNEFRHHQGRLFDKFASFLNLHSEVFFGTKTRPKSSQLKGRFSSFRKWRQHHKGRVVVMALARITNLIIEKPPEASLMAWWIHYYQKSLELCLPRQ